MARYELGAIYKIDGQNGEIYYARLLTNDCYGIFAPFKDELNQEIFSQVPYRLYIICNSFPVKRGIWEKVMPSPDKTDTTRWKRPKYLANFGNFNRKLFIEQCRVYHEDGNLYKCESKKKFITLVKSGMIALIFNRHEIIPAYLMKIYENYPNSYIIDKEFIHSGTPEYQKEQLDVLKELGFDTNKLL
ncbi:MAG: hypothetical protein ACK5N4_12655 [Parabacteroides gordonii]|uniref:hypothetical protein n=1 Tax=Parabacteroides gordonii TaxID=574930 RepID=UPI003A898FA4